jgi:flavodoxin
MPKSLIVYASYSGNTEKVAMVFKRVFEKYGWECDAFKITKKTDFEHPPYDYNKYDFVCIGSLVASSEPVPEIMDAMRKNPLSAHYKTPDGKAEGYRKVTTGPKKGIVFATAGCVHMGPKEPIPALTNMALELEHLKFQCVGQFWCPGKMFDRPMPEYFYKDLHLRPHERDLKKAEIFMEETIEENFGDWSLA